MSITQIGETKPTLILVKSAGHTDFGDANLVTANEMSARDTTFEKVTQCEYIECFQQTIWCSFANSVDLNECIPKLRIFANLDNNPHKVL